MNKEYVVCLPVTYEVKIPSEKTNCSLCERKIWISVASHQEAKKRNAAAICVNCANELADEFPDEIEMRSATEEQLREIKEALN